MDIERSAFQAYLKKNGWHWARQCGSHIQFKKLGEKDIITIVADRTLSIGVVKKALKRMKISDEDFRAEFFKSKKKS